MDTHRLLYGAAAAAAMETRLKTGAAVAVAAVKEAQQQLNEARDHVSCVWFWELTATCCHTVYCLLWRSSIPSYGNFVAVRLLSDIVPLGMAIGA